MTPNHTCVPNEGKRHQNWSQDWVTLQVNHKTSAQKQVLLMSSPHLTPTMDEGEQWEVGTQSLPPPTLNSHTHYG